MKKTFIVSFAVLMASISFGQTAPTAAEYGAIIEKMMKQIKAIKTLQYDFDKNERFEGKIVVSKQFVKQNITPKKIFMHLKEGPNSGSDVWFIPGENGGKARVSASKFVPTLSLSPFSSLMRDKQRNTIYELGFEYMGNLIYQNYLRFKDKGDALIKDGWAKYDGIIKYDGKDCHKVTMTDKSYKIVNYTVLAGETTRKIAQKLLLDEYGLIELNGTAALKTGQIIKVPTSFCKEIMIYIDVKTSLPMYTKIWDDKGMVGEYAYHNLILNPTFTDADFKE
jgi:outer membrane lipoprotein-sorting protein